MMAWQHMALLALAFLMLGGCTALGITGGAMAVAAVGAGAGEFIRAGTEYSLAGTAYQTFTMPLDGLLEATRTALNRMAFTIEREEEMSPEHLVVARGIGRTIEIELQPLSTAVTRLELVVKRNLLQRDRATASEILTQIELVIRSGLDSHE